MLICTDFAFVTYSAESYGGTEASDTCADNAYLEAFRGLWFDHHERLSGKYRTARVIVQLGIRLEGVW